MPRIPTGRDNHGCEIIDTENGKELWVIGGYGDGHCFDSVEIFNFDTMQWSTGTPLPGPRAGLSTTVIDNNILVIGGSDDNFAHSVIWEWSAKFNRWTQSDVELDGPRSFFGATLVDERSGATCSL